MSVSCKLCSGGNKHYTRSLLKQRIFPTYYTFLIDLRFFLRHGRLARDRELLARNAKAYNLAWQILDFYFSSAQEKVKKYFLQFLAKIIYL